MAQTFTPSATYGNSAVKNRVKPGGSLGSNQYFYITNASTGKIDVQRYAKSTDANRKNALRFINCLSVDNHASTGAKLSFRDEEDQVSAQYFCRVRSGHMNFSNNPTFVSGSENKLRNSKMRGNPQTFITGVQLYNENGQMVAVAHLSKPLKKNFSSESTIKVKLTY